MKKNNLTEIKNMDAKAILSKVVALRSEMADLVLDINLNKVTDKKAITKKKKDLAQMLTIVRQKQLLEVLTKEEENVSNVSEVSKEGGGKKF